MQTLLKPLLLDGRLYRAALYLYPPAFRREFGGEMVRDFEEARLERCAAGAVTHSWSFHVHITTDFVKTVVWQWLRTGLPVIALVSAGIPLLVAGLLADFSRSQALKLPAGTPDADVIALALLVMVVLFIVASTILLTLFFSRSLLHRRRS
jgi:hypothetical protein